MIVTRDLESVRTNGKSFLEVRVTGKLTADDYKRLVPDVEDLVRRQGKVRILLIMEDFEGWTAGALWEDIKFDFRHFNDIDRLAIVGEAKWQKSMARFCRPFTTAEIRYFDREKLPDARRWLEGLDPDGKEGRA